MVRKMPIPTCQELTASVGDKANHPVVTYIPRAVFGVTLDEALDVAQIANLPAIVFRSIQYLEAKKADQEEGIYRLSGSSAVIKSLKDRFNMGMRSYPTHCVHRANSVAEGDVDLLASDEYWDPHAIAGLLKSFLRELPASILTRDLHLRFLAVIGASVICPSWMKLTPPGYHKQTSWMHKNGLGSSHS